MENIFLLGFLFLFLLLVIATFIRVHMLQDKLVSKNQGGVFGQISLYKRHTGEVWLHMCNVIQGIDARTFIDELSYWHKVRDVILDYKNSHLIDKSCNILHLGLGGATIPMLVAAKDPSIIQTVVEIDENLIELVNDQLGVSKVPSIQMKHADAFELMNSKFNFDQKFDIVLIDVFSDFASLNNPGTSELEFVEYYKSQMKEHGLLVFNHPSHNTQAREGAMKLMKLVDNRYGGVEWEEVHDVKRNFWNIVIWVSF